jgi:hypothetical protein
MAVARAVPPPFSFRSLPVRLLAAATGADPRTVERWRAGSVPRARYRARVDELGAVMRILAGSMVPEARAAWLEARNPFLDWQRPADLLAEGRFDEVRGAAEAYQAGDFV